MSHEHNGEQADDCISEPLPPDERYISSAKSPEHERDDIRTYMDSQAADESIVHLEKVTTEVVYGRRYDVWDVHTDKARWWVITLPTNLYSQDMFPSMDMCLTFHVGLSSRLLGQESEQDDVARLLIKSLRRLTAASDALDEAREVEEFQAVGMMLREALLALTRELADADMVPSDAEQPKLGDFVHWSEYITDALTDDETLKRLRVPLKAAAKDTWQVVNNLTHTTSANATLASLAAQQTQHLFEQWALLLRAIDDKGLRCPVCDSLRVIEQTAIVEGLEVEHLLCESCGATARRAPEYEE